MLADIETPKQPQQWEIRRAQRAIANAIAKQIAGNLPPDKVKPVLTAMLAHDKAGFDLRCAILDAARIN